VISEPPRTVPWKLRLRWLRDRPVAFLLGVFFVGFPPVMVLPQYWALSRIESQLAGDVDYGMLARQGKDASGEMIGVRIGEVTVFGRERPWVVEYRFVANGREHRAEMKTLDKHSPGDWREGHPVSVRYLGPESMITDVEPYAPTLWKLWIFGLCGEMTFGLPFLLYAIAGMRKKVTLYQSGALAKGRISAMHLATWLGFMPLFKFRFKVTYRFQDHDDKEVLGSSISTNVALLNGGKQGDPVDILFLGSRPEVNCLAEKHDLLALPDDAQHRDSLRDHLTQ